MANCWGRHALNIMSYQTYQTYSKQGFVTHPISGFSNKCSTFWTFHNNGKETKRGRVIRGSFVLCSTLWLDTRRDAGDPVDRSRSQGIGEIGNSCWEGVPVTFKSQKSHNSKPKSFVFLCYSVLGNGRNTIQNVRSHLSHNFPQSPIKNITDWSSFK